MLPRTVVIVSFVVALLAWAGLAALVMYAQPAPTLIAIAAPIIVLAVGASATPLWLLVQRRLAPAVEQKALGRVALREGLWTGLYTAALAFLRLNGFLDWVLALVLLVIFVLLETFLQQRSQRQQTPRKPPGGGKAPSSSSVAKQRSTPAPVPKSAPKSKPEKSHFTLPASRNR